VSSQSQRSIPDPVEAETRPIEFLTENGFFIQRPWEIDQSEPPCTGSFDFLVRDPQGLERRVKVEIAHHLVLRIAIQTGQRILLANSFWICCAERHLANHLWETNDFPLRNELRIAQLDPEDITTASRWRGW
jgi:hypothetical protein